MNKQIQKLIDQCTDTVEIYNDITSITYEREFFDKEEFAELIVRESAAQCLSDDCMSSLNHFGVKR